MNDNVPDDDRDRLRLELDRLGQEIDQIRSACAEAGQGFAAHYLGDVALQPAPDVETVLSFLSAASAPVRQAAFGLLSDKQIETDESLRIARDAARSDADALVQKAAIHYLISRFDASRSEYYSQFFAEIVTDERQPTRVRLTAYKGLIYLHDLSLEWTPSIESLRFPQDIDWSFVNHWLT